VLKLKENQVKIVSIVIAVFFLIGGVGIVVSQGGKVAAAPSVNIGIVDFQLLMSQQPEADAAEKAMQAAINQANKDFEAKSASLNDQEKQNYHNQLQQQLSKKQQELFTPIRDKVVAAIKEVADSKGLAVVLDKGEVSYGGQDITVEVGKKITGK